MTETAPARTIDVGLCLSIYKSVEVGDEGIMIIPIEEVNVHFMLLP